MRLSVEILQLQNIPIVWHYLRDPTFSLFYTIPECDRQTHRHTTTAYTALSIASCGKNWLSSCDTCIIWKHIWLVCFEVNFGVRQRSELSPFIE